MQDVTSKIRTATINRTTKETSIALTLNIDGSGVTDISTGIGFFDHMLTTFACHGLFDLTLSCKGDLHIDSHHTVEDVGIALGEAIKAALGDKAGIRRSGSMAYPLDDVLMLCAVDLSGRGYFVSDLEFSKERIGDLETEVFCHFLESLAISSGMNLHIKHLFGQNNHHLAEATIKSFAKSLDAATMYDQRISGVLSTKGSL